MVHEQPIITLSEDKKKYRFDTGSAELKTVFIESLRAEIIPEIRRLGDLHAARVIEIVGHTDEVRVDARRVTNLDDKLLPFLAGTLSEELRAKDNVGLGMARAAAVARLLKAELTRDCFTVLPMSAGQTVDAEMDALAQPRSADTIEEDQRRRRIEVRLRPARDDQAHVCRKADRAVPTPSAGNP